MKRTISIVLILIMLFGTMFSVSASAAENRIYADDIVVENGASIEIPICIENNSGFMGFAINVQYDSAVLTPVSVDKCDLLSGMFDDSIEISDLGGFKVVYTGTENVVADGQLFIVTFETGQNASESTQIKLSYSKEDTFDEDYHDVAFQCESITVHFKGADDPIEPVQKLSVRIKDWAVGLRSPFNIILTVLVAPVLFVLSVFGR